MCAEHLAQQIAHRKLLVLILIGPHEQQVGIALARYADKSVQPLLMPPHVAEAGEERHLALAMQELAHDVGGDAPELN